MTSKTQIIDESGSNLRALAAILTITLTIGLYVLQLFTFPVDEAILDTQVRIVDLESTVAQGSFYIVLLGFIAAICTSLLVWPKMKINFGEGSREDVLVIGTVLLTIVLGSWSKQFLFGFVAVAIVVTCSRVGLFQPISSILSRLTPVQDQQFTWAFFWLFIFLVLVYFIVFLIVPLTTPLVISGPEEMRWVEGHYAVSVLPGFDLICCSEVGTIERANYGLGMPLLTVIALKGLSLFGALDTALVQVVKFNQLIAVAMICILSFLTNKKYFPYVMAIALGMTAFTLSNIGQAVPYPNQSGIRYVPLLGSLFILVIEMRRVYFRLWVLASFAAIFVILSPGTGLAATAGYIVAGVLVRYSSNRPISSVAVTLTRFFGIFLITGVAGSFLIIDPILKTSSGELFQFLSLFTIGGYGGLIDKPSMMATLLFFVATISVLRGVWCARNGTRLPSDAFEAAVGTIILVWLMYYVNRMAEWNLWFQSVLLMMMIAPRLMHEIWQQLFGNSLKSGLTSSLIVACLIGGQLTSSLAQSAHQFTNWSKWEHLECTERLAADDMCLPWLRGTKFEIQMNALIDGYSPAETLVLTGVSTHARLHGFNEGFPWYDPMEVVTSSEVEVIVNWMEVHGPRFILADDPSYEIAVAAPEHSEQIQSYLLHLDSYREVNRQSGWIILERVTIPLVESN